VNPGRPDDLPEPSEGDPDPLVRFRSWRGFLFAAVAVNLLFLYGIAGQSFEPTSAVLVKTLTWLPFNLIATVLYYVFMIKLGRDASGAALPGGRWYGALCIVMIVLNWIAFFNL